MTTDLEKFKHGFLHTRIMGEIPWKEYPGRNKYPVGFSPLSLNTYIFEWMIWVEENPCHSHTHTHHILVFRHRKTKDGRGILNISTLSERIQVILHSGNLPVFAHSLSKTLVLNKSLNKTETYSSHIVHFYFSQHLSIEGGKKKNNTMWEFWVKFYWGQNEDYS